MVILSKIYTRTGDAGSTRLSDNSPTRKTDLRVQAYGEVDECNSQVGVALAAGVPDDVAAVLSLVQNELFDVGADLSAPLQADPEWPALRIEQPSIDRLEGFIDDFGDDLPTLRSFILPGGTPAAAALHVARTMCRRAERTAWAAVEAHGTDTAPGRDAGGGVSLLAVTYLNRLSDLLFVLTRVVNRAAGVDEVLWQPGTGRPVPDTRRRNPQAPGEDV